MKIIGLLTSLLILGPAWASDVKISYSPSNNLVLTGSSCETLLKEHEAICTWKKSIHQEFIIPEISRTNCRRNTQGISSITVSDCLPELVKTHQNKKLYQNGANCWGTAMNFKKISLKPRFIWSNEMTYWLESPLCRKLSPGEKKEPGDIINIYGPEYVFQQDEESNKGLRFWEALFPGRLTSTDLERGYSGYHNFLHSETFISDRITFGKDSPNKDDKFMFHPINEVYGRSRSPECQENQTLTPHLREYQNTPKRIKHSKCDYFSLAYRCGNLTDYFKQQDLNQNEKYLLNEIEELKLIQEKLFRLVSEPRSGLSKVVMETWLKASDELAQESLYELSRPGINKNLEMLLTLKYFSASGIRKSLELAALTPATEEI